MMHVILLLPPYPSNGVVTVEDCVQEAPGSPSCVINNPLMWIHKHLINVTEVNPLGVQQTIVRVDLRQLSTRSLSFTLSLSYYTVLEWS